MDALVDSAVDMLTSAWGRRVCAAVLSRHNTSKGDAARLQVADDLSAVFVKKVTDRHAFSRELAALRFLGELRSPLQLCPELYAYDGAEGLLIMEDLGAGESPTTDSALSGTDPDLALRCLIEHARLLATLHGLTLGRWEQYRRLRSEIQRSELFADPWPENDELPRSTDELAGAAQAYADVLASIGVRADPRCAEEIVYVGQATEGVPSGRWALCKGDQNMAGDYVRIGGIARLMDFGEAGFRPMFSEGMPERMTWGCMMALPEHAASGFSAAYRKELATHSPELAIDRQSVAESAARWNIFHTLVRLPRALEGDYQRGPSTLRQQTVAWLRAFADGDTESRYPGLASGSLDCLAALRSRWDQTAFQLPIWPAFARRSSP